MAKVPSAMLPLNTQAPDFLLTDTVTNKPLSLKKLAGKNATVIFFICNHCPYVKHIIGELPKFANAYINKGVSFVAINSNDVSRYPDDSPENMAKMAKSYNFPFPYLFDGTQEVARAYDARCTPDFYVFDKDLSLVYRGQFDDSRLGNNIMVTGDSIGRALDRIIADLSVPEEQKPSLGCSIKWKEETNV